MAQASPLQRNVLGGKGREKETQEADEDQQEKGNEEWYTVVSEAIHLHMQSQVSEASSMVEFHVMDCRIHKF